MTTMTERVARAIGAKLDPTTPWDECGQGFKEICVDAARAALEAMKEPTPTMIAAMDEHAGTIAPEYAYQDAITAALEEGE